MPVIEAGRPAPDFSLARLDRAPFARRDLESRLTVLVFYPFAFSPVCTDQLGVYNDLLDDFDAVDATLYGVSVDNVWSQDAFKRHLGIEIEQLSDFEPKGATSAAFGLLHPGGFAQRALVVIGPDAVISWSHETDSLDDAPGANLIFDAIAA